jgi:hypothetical protein
MPDFPRIFTSSGAGAPAAVADGYSTAILSVLAPSLKNLHGVGDRAFVRVRYLCVTGILDAGHFVPQRIDARIRGDFLFIMIGGEGAEISRRRSYIECNGRGRRDCAEVPTYR